ncbi:MAG: hypothetical protein KGN34_02805 [Sphingomonadales bacterium]|nr:hypothetical protein [Sphingomonadales bacterium]
MAARLNKRPGVAFGMALLGASTVTMAQTPPTAAALTGSEVIPCIQEGSQRGCTARQVAATIFAGGTSGTLPVANGGTGTSTATGAGAAVLANNPTLVAPTLTASTAAAPSLTLMPGTTPVAPANGSVWATTQGLYAQIGGSTVIMGPSAGLLSTGRMLKAILPTSTVYGGGTATFSANAYTLARNQQACPAALYKGQTLAMTAGSGNTGAATLNFCGLGAKAIKLVNSAGTVLALTGGEIVAGQPLVLTYDGTQYLLPWAGSINTLGSGTLTATAANFANGDLIAATGTLTLTLPCSATLSPNGRLHVIAPGGALTIQRGGSCASDALVRNGASGTSQVLAQGTGTQVVVTNGSGTFYLSGT